MLNNPSRSFPFLILHFNSRNGGSLLEKGKFFYHVFLLIDHVFKRGQSLVPRLELRWVWQILSLKVIDVVATIQMGRAVSILSRPMMLLIHLLTKTIAISNLCRDGSKLFDKIYFKKISHGVKSDKQLRLSMWFDLLYE